MPDRRLDTSRLADECRKHGVVYAGLFGSQARDEATTESDVDVLVRFGDRRSLIDLVRIERRIEEVVGVSVDLVTENALSPHLRDRVLEDLEVIVDDE
ncbi:MAG: nucleotidyltransferase family protein [Salinibacter sp.]